MLDLYGTDHDPRCWEEPALFHPERFQGCVEDPFDFIPQGGGEYERGHRCPGEGITIAPLRVALEFLTRRLEYEVPQ